MIKYLTRPLILITNWIIKIGQGYVNLDGMGFDALVIGFLVASSIKIRSIILSHHDTKD